MFKAWLLPCLLFVAAGSSGFAVAAGATLEFKKNFVRISPTQRVYVEYREAEKGQPTLILLNGLTWDTRHWRVFVDAVSELSPGIGILLYDMEGQGQTLLDKAPITSVIPIENQVHDLHNLIRHFDFTGPRVLVGLSYGGGVGVDYAATYPQDYDQLILMAPFLQRLPDQDIMLNNTVKNHRILFPFDTRSDDELYDIYLRGLIYSTYPPVEPILLENPYKLEATFRMVQGAKRFVASDLAQKLGGQRVHLMGGEKDPFVRDLELQAFWSKIEGGASYLRLKNTTHKIPEDRPELSARWVLLLMSGDSRLFEGRTFEMDPVEMIARSGNIEIPVESKNQSKKKSKK